VPDRDLFANFDRMRREMDELFGDVFERTRMARGRAGFSPAVDVVYTSDPPCAVVTAEVAGVTLEDLELEIQGRQLILSGIRNPAPPARLEGELYQQIEIERGPFRRIVELGAEVVGERTKASLEDGMLRVELPLRQSPPQPTRAVPVQRVEDL
jgi:HSP20 family protein